jgi:SAM-dependent methyltransferase
VSRPALAAGSRSTLAWPGGLRHDTTVEQPAGNPGASAKDIAMAKNAHWSDNLKGVERAALAATGQAYRSQETILEHLLTYYRPKTVVDIGCGPGYWLYFCRALGIQDVHGYDTVDLPAEEQELPAEFYSRADLSKPMDFERKADLAISTEVAEHIEVAQVEIFIDNLTRASDVVLFSAALPYQGGLGHVNENWVEYWFQLFSKRNYRCFDIFRLPLWNDSRIHYYYRQNILLFVHQDRTPEFEAKGLQEEPHPLSLIHPDLYIQAVNRGRPPEARRLAQDARLYYQCVAATQETFRSNEQNYTYGRENVWYDIGKVKSMKEQLEQERTGFRRQIQDLKHEIRILRHEREGWLNSTSWRVTKPLRTLAIFFRKGRKT